MYGQFLDRGKANLFPSAGRRIVKMKLKVVAATLAERISIVFAMDKKTVERLSLFLSFLISRSLAKAVRTL